MRFAISIIHNFIEPAFLLVFIINSVARRKSVRKKYRFENAVDIRISTDGYYYFIMKIAL